MSVICCDTCPFSPTCEEEEDQVSHSYRRCDDYLDGDRSMADVIPDDWCGEAMA